MKRRHFLASAAASILVCGPFARAAPAMFVEPASGLQSMRSGKVRPLAIGSPSRSALRPDVPTLGEMGFTDTEVFAFQGMAGPAGLPAPIIERVNRELNKALADPLVLQRFTDFGFEPLRIGPTELKQLARAESARWGEVSRANKITLN